MRKNIYIDIILKQILNKFSPRWCGLVQFLLEISIKLIWNEIQILLLVPKVTFKRLLILIHITR